jgi:hypothetical protein
MSTSFNRQASMVLAMVALLLLGACSSEPGATATPTKTPGAVQHSAATKPPPVLATPIPTVTPNPPSPTPDPEPAVTPQPEVIEGLIGPEVYEHDVNPLTGKVMTDPTVLDRRPVAVKISNYPPQHVRPQAGLDKADIVIEHYAEGGATRLTAIFYGQGASQVGSIRSGRMIDLEIPAMYQSAFAYSGASAGVREKIRYSDFYGRVISPDFGYGEPYFYRMPRDGVPFEHTLFADLYDIWAWLDDNDNNTRPELKGLAFSDTPPAGGVPVSNLLVGYLSADCQVKWVYTPATGRYLRWQGGAKHTELLSGAQISAANVVIVGAHHKDTDILEDHVAGGHYSVQIQIWGDGPASLFRDGQRYEGRWQRTNREDMLVFTDLDGAILPFKPGNTWFQMVPLGFDRLIVEP